MKRWFLAALLVIGGLVAARIDYETLGAFLGSYDDPEVHT